MGKKNFFIKFFLFLLFINIFTSKKFKGIANTLSKLKNPYKKNKSNLNKRNLENDDEYKTIRILFDHYHFDNEITTQTGFPREIYYDSFENCILIIKKLIRVKPIKNAIQVDFSQYPDTELNPNIVNGTLKTGNNNYDLIIIPKIRFHTTLEMNSTSIIRDNDTNRTTLGIIEIGYKESSSAENYDKYLEYLLLHHIIHLLGFSYESFEYFPGGKDKTYKIDKDIYGLDCNYIITKTVLEVAKKYFGCNDITGVPLENQKENNNIAHWEPRILLGDIMTSYYTYKSEHVISEFTLALLEDSGWYKINYYTGGLMRFGKHKGCEFLTHNCSDEFKNEFYKYRFGEDFIPSCSSGRQSRSYRIQKYANIPDVYKRFEYNYGGFKLIDYCIISDYDGENDNNYFNGNCKFGNNKYGSEYINYGIYKDMDISSYFNETFSEKSFCVLTSIDRVNTNKNLKQFLQPLCYEMLCSEKSLTIKIGEQYIVCPRSGGKIELNGNFEGYIYCPDYNLICTGTIICNNLFDCIGNETLAKNDTYYYDYEIKTNQQHDELANEELQDGYELSENGKCPINCNQCFEEKKCIKCRKNYNIVGDKKNNNKALKCEDIDVSKGYYMEDYIYYPCFSKCDVCKNDTLCEKCTDKYYFIKDDRTYCDTGKDLKKYYTTDNGISYFPCNLDFEYCDECDIKGTCNKCIKNYYFIKTKDKCETGKDLTCYFSEDGGILYLLCSDYIYNCSTCSSRDNCKRCVSEYYFIGYDRTRCHTGINFEEYYTNDGGISYFPCDTEFPYCLKCTNSKTCSMCKDGYIFLRGEKKQCFTNEPNKTYIENGNYYPCNDSLPFCDECGNKYQCNKCFQDYYFVRNKNNIIECLKIDIKKYYQSSDGTYKLCSEAINNCDECNNPTICTKCKKNYYFLEKDFNNCRNDLDLRKYYSEDNGISYYPCSIMTECKYCSNKSICEECNNNFYLYKDDKANCIYLDDLEKYYKIGPSYYPCNEAITNCNKCYDAQSCYECINGLKIIYKEQNKCYEDSYFEGNKSYYKKNDTFYEKCSTSMPHCNICDDNTICHDCEKDHYFINDNYRECININNIKPEKEYYKEGSLNYYTCSFKGVKNCKECNDKNTCYLCNDNYALLSNNYSYCHPKSELSKGYYHDENGMYFSCINNCDICTNGIECIQCSENFITFADDKVCDICKLNINTITEELSNDLIKKYINDYINKNKNLYSVVDFYINEEQNYTITIFRTWYCTTLLLQNDYFEINTEDINNKLRYNLKNSKHYVISYINYKYKNYIEIYDNEENQQINFSENDNILKITNNFTKEMNISLGEIIQNKIKENDINIFDKDDPIFNDICNNFTVENIDLPIKERRELFYLGYMQKEFICNDINCDIESISMDNYTGICNCKIETNINNLFLDNEQSANNMTNEEYNKYINSKSSINSFLIFKCAKQSFSKNIKNNANLYISCAIIAIQILFYGLYVGLNYKPKKTKKNQKKTKNNKSNPPKIEKFSVSDDLEEENNDFNSFNEKGDFEKENQEKDKQIIYNEDVDEDDVGDPEKNIQDKDIDSVREKEIENEIINSGGELTEETLTTRFNLFRERRFKNKIGNYEKEIINSESSQVNPEDKPGQNKYKLKFEEENFSGDEGATEMNNMNINKLKRNKNKKYNDLNQIERSSITSKESFSPSEINNIQNDIIQKTEYANFTEVIKKPLVSYWEYYWKLLQLKQPIINLFSPIRFLKIEESFITTLVKLMRFIFYISLNIFFNILHLEQKYFRKKYKYFNKKYNISYELLNEKISSNERFAYGLRHAALAGFISFLICLIIQSVLNFFFFDIKKKLAKIGDATLLGANQKKNNKNNKNNRNNKKEDILELMRKAKKLYVIFFGVGFAIMIIIFYAAINFAEVYRGGVLDFVAGLFWTFIFLQIIPFIYCLLFAYLRYKGIKDNNEKLFIIGQSIFF